jgi:hypothetical protein
MTSLSRRLGAALTVVALAAGPGSAGAHAALEPHPAYAPAAQDAGSLAGTTTSDAQLQAVLNKLAAKIGGPKAPSTTSIFDRLAAGQASAAPYAVVMPGARPSGRLDNLMRQLGPCAFGWC